MKSVKQLTLSFGLILAVNGTVAFAQDNGGGESELTADQIVDKAMVANYYAGKDGRSNVSMTIHDKQGRTRSRELIILRRDSIPEDVENEETFQGDQKYYAYFRRPADVRKTVFMVWKHVKEEREDDRWLYLPDLDLVKRIASSEKRSSFVGTHFFYEDVSGRTAAEDHHELEKTTDNYYVLKNTPKKPDEVEFDYYRTWIHKETFLVTQTQYFDEQDEEYRTYTAKKVETVQGYPTVVEARMSDSRIGGYTDVEYSKTEYDIGLPDNIFTERFLRKAPLEYLR
ncbi:MAG: outer membrane lipoprotein-sorting protein [Verrucomicrobiota bacterium]